MSATKRQRTKALVLGGGGITGAAWELGILAGLREAGVDVTDADLVEGTSAGSVVGAQITSGQDLEVLFANQLKPIEGTKEDVPPPDMLAGLQALAAGFDAPDKQTARMRIGAAALAAPTMPEEERLEMVANRVSVKDWPARRLVTNAVDARTGEWITFDRNAGVPLLQAVEASTAVPGVYPPATIGEHRYMDGGMSSPSNADFARGHDRVLIILPMAPALSARGGPMEPILRVTFDDELDALKESGAQVLVITPDDASVDAFGPNMLDPHRRAPSAQAGRVQGRALAEGVKRLWTE